MKFDFEILRTDSSIFYTLMKYGNKNKACATLKSGQSLCCC